MTWVNEGGLAMTWEKGGFWIPACAGMASRFGEDGDEGACNAPLLGILQGRENWD